MTRERRGDAPRRGADGDHGASHGGGTPAPRGTSRRSFLKAGGLVAAGAAAGGASGAAAGATVAAAQVPLTGGTQSTPVPIAPRAGGPGFDHLVVVMFENRSFDNLLGWLYTEQTLPEGASFEGLAQGSYANTAVDGAVYEAHPYQGPTDRIMSAPDPDPGEAFPHVNTQLFGVVDPASNDDLTENPPAAPYNAPPSGKKADNSGFVRDYDINFQRIKGRAPTPAELRVAMGGYTPDMLPPLTLSDR